MSFVAALLFLAPSPLPQEPRSADAWPQWRGPARDGTWSGPAWPESLDAETLRLAWRFEGLGPSYAGPIVTPDRVFSVETRDESEERVRAFDRASGEELWSTSWPGAMEVPFFAAKNGSWVRSTPAWDGERLYVAGMRDVLVCLDAADGTVQWCVDFTERDGMPLPAFGFVSSPLVVGDHVYVQAGGAFAKLDKLTGATVWRALEDGGGMDSSFSSPVLGRLAGEQQLVVQSRTHLSGVDPDSGAVHWTTPVRAFRGMNILTPTLVGDAVYVSAYGGRSQRFEVSHEAEEFAVTGGWEGKAQGYMTSPVVVDGHAYLFLRSNRFSCVRLADGEELWTSPPTGDEYWSLVAREGRILALANTGELRLIAADPERYTVLSSRVVSEDPTWAHLAVAGDTLFVREQGALAAWTWAAPDAPEPGGE